MTNTKIYHLAHKKTVKPSLTNRYSLINLFSIIFMSLWPIFGDCFIIFALVYRHLLNKQIIQGNYEVKDVNKHTMG